MKPGTWTAAVNRGGLVSATEEMERHVKIVDRLFTEFHVANDIRRGPSIRARTINAIKNHPDALGIDPRVIVIFTKLKMGHRIKQLNNGECRNIINYNKNKHVVF